MFLRFISIFVPIMLVIVGWRFMVNGLFIPNSSAISVSGQISFISANPLEYMGILLNTIWGNYHYFLVMFVGNFGRLDTPLPNILVYIFIIVLSLVSILDKSKVNIVLKQKLISLIILSIVFISIFTLEFITWTPVGSATIAGIQGRYFIPVAPLFFILFFNKKFNYDLKFFNKTIIFFIIIVLIFTLFIIIRRYYIL